MINIGYIKNLMENHHMTLGQLAVKSGISKAQWSRVFSGKRGVGPKTLAGVMKVFPEADYNKIFLS